MILDINQIVMEHAVNVQQVHIHQMEKNVKNAQKIKYQHHQVQNHALLVLMEKNQMMKEQHAIHVEKIIIPIQQQKVGVKNVQMVGLHLLVQQNVQSFVLRDINQILNKHHVQHVHLLVLLAQHQLENVQNVKEDIN